ncbi:MAG TPA: Na+/H+ antiporter NhaA, partial [Pedobacter sp.]
MENAPRSGIEKIINPVIRFIHLEYTSGIILFASVVAALIWANSAFSAAYHHLWETEISIGAGRYTLDHPLHIWINDGLMAVFFFVIGL